MTFFPKLIFKRVLDTFIKCDSDIFHLIKTALHIVCTLPVNVASAERSFSTLKRIKSWLRSTMSQERLVGLALLHIHRENTVCLSVVNAFAHLKNRKLDFVL